MGAPIGANVVAVVVIGATIGAMAIGATIGAD